MRVYLELKRDAMLLLKGHHDGVLARGKEHALLDGQLVARARVHKHFRKRPGVSAYEAKKDRE